MHLCHQAVQFSSHLHLLLPYKLAISGYHSALFKSHSTVIRVHPLRRFFFQCSKPFPDTIAKLRRGHLTAQVSCAEKHPRQPCLRQPVGLGKESDDDQDAQRNHQYALEKSEDSACKPIEPSESK